MCSLVLHSLCAEVSGSESLPFEGRRLFVVERCERKWPGSVDGHPF